MKDHGVSDSLLTVIKLDEERSKKEKRLYWICKCECGNFTTKLGQHIRGSKNTKPTLSCGCLPTGRKKTDIYLQNFIGQQFERLTVRQYTKTINSQDYYLCDCICGNTTEVRINDLVLGKIKSCGCLRDELTSKRSCKDSEIIGHIFGQLIPEYCIGSDSHGNHIWHCKCSCGNTTDVIANALLQGSIQSCGCLVSKGEAKIKAILQNNNIEFSEQKIFPDLIGDAAPLRFDFFINNQFLLEYDGKQHFDNELHFNNSFEEQNKYKQYDILKNQYCKIHNIPLKRIPYWDLDKITLENIMSDKWLVNN